MQKKFQNLPKNIFDCVKLSILESSCYGWSRISHQPQPDPDNSSYVNRIHPSPNVTKVYTNIIQFNCWYQTREPTNVRKKYRVSVKFWRSNKGTNSKIYVHKY